MSGISGLFACSAALSNGLELIKLNVQGVTLHL